MGYMLMFRAVNEDMHWSTQSRVVGCIKIKKNYDLPKNTYTILTSNFDNRIYLLSVNKCFFVVIFNFWLSCAITCRGQLTCSQPPRWQR